MKSAALLFAALAVLASPAAARERLDEKLAHALGGRVAGEPVSCIRLASVRSSRIIDGQGILYRIGASKVYLNRPTIGADRLDRDDILVTSVPSTNLCRLDTINLFARPSAIPRGFVTLGDFVPYTRSAKR